MLLLPFLAALPLGDQALAAVRVSPVAAIVAPSESDRWSNMLLLGRIAGEQMDNWWAADGLMLIAAAVDPAVASRVLSTELPPFVTPGLTRGPAACCGE